MISRPRLFAPFAMLLALLANVACSTGASHEAPTTKTSHSLPRYEPRFNRERPVVAIVGENTFTELTDYVVPYGVLKASGIADVFALATQPGALQLFPALRVQPEHTTAEFDVQFPEGADYVIVPAVHRTDDPTLLEWVRAQASKGATIAGVCDGVWVLANARLLTGKQAVGHWYSFDDLAKKFPATTFVRDRRYLADGNIITTTGVTASIPASIALIEAIAGQAHASAVAESLGVHDWSDAHASAHFSLTARRMWTAATNWLAFWSHEKMGIAIEPGVDEIALALVADITSRTYRSSAHSVSESGRLIKTQHGLLIYADDLSPKHLDHLFDLPDIRPIESVDWALRLVEELYGKPTADFVALQIEYTRPQ